MEAFIVKSPQLALTGISHQKNVPTKQNYGHFYHFVSGYYIVYLNKKEQPP